jgi:hypothetical protein
MLDLEGQKKGMIEGAGFRALLLFMKPARKPKRAAKNSPAGFDPAQAVERALPDIVAALIKQAEQGSYQHAKFLFELAGIGNLQQPSAPEEESLAALLFRELQLEES